MSTVDREKLRRALLLAAEASAPYGVALPLFVLGALDFGLHPERVEIEKELAYLEDKGLIERVEKKISPENRMWRLTAEGRDYVAENLA